MRHVVQQCVPSPSDIGFQQILPMKNLGFDSDHNRVKQRNIASIKTHCTLYKYLKKRTRGWVLIKSA